MSEGAERLVEDGNALYQRGDAEGALECYQRAVERDPASARAHYNAGVVLHGLGRHEPAADHFAKAAALRPDWAKVYVNWGNALVELGRSAEAERMYARALEADARDLPALANLALLAQSAGRTDEAAALYERIVAIDDRNPDAHYHVAMARHLAGRFREAAGHFERAFELRPGFIGALEGWAHSLSDAGDRDAALELYRKLLEADPANAKALNNLAAFELDRGRLDAARAFFERARDSRPDLLEPRYNLALIALKRHEFAVGWKEYDLRLDVDAATMGLAPSALPRLRALEHAPGRVAVRKEQGIGDQILFSTLLPELSKRVGSLVVEVDPRLVACYRRSLPGIEFVTPSEAARAFDGSDAQVPMGSIPALLRPDVRSFARQPQALFSAQESRKSDVASLLPMGKRIGIAWRTFQRGRHQFVSERKSATLDALAPLARCGATLVDLQYGDVAAERHAFDRAHPAARFQLAGLDTFADLEGLLALIDCCDVVVTTSNATAHFAGALGKRTWVVYLEANAPFHYWVAGPDGRSLWYPSVQVMTDPSWRDWSQAFDAVAARCQSEVR